MSRSRQRKLTGLTVAIVVSMGLLWQPVSGVYGADHGDAPNASNDTAADINDVFAFLDPNDNSQIVLIHTVRGFIAAGENANFGQFDHRILHFFELELTGDAVADAVFFFTFSPQASRTVPQTMTVYVFIPSTNALFTLFTAPTTISTTADTPPAQTVTTHGPTGIRAFAGMTDDPFFFDIPGFGRFVASVLAGAIDPTQLQRGRDSFAGYNTMAIAISLPRSLLGAVSTLGVGSRTVRVSGTLGQPGFTVIEQIDRMGNPAVNVALVPFAAKNAYNLASSPQDAAGQFATGIVGTLTALGTSPANIGTLAAVAVNNGDLLRLNLNTANTGPGGGNNAAAAFPNGRRLADDTIDILLTIITNGAITTGDNVNSNESPLQNTFPFLALPNQPFAPGTLDDLTRN
jgi:Domain of unknown function (DUF4331)